MPEEPAVTKPAPKKRLALFLDGTLKKVENNTNVSRLHSLCSPKSADGSEQLPYYHPGVTGLLGLLYGRHLSRNIRCAYEWLIDHYNPGDEIFIFGFSRGAYTARSLTGYIAKCGLLKRGAPLGVNQLYNRYRRPDARTIWNLIESRNAGTLGQTTPEEKSMLEYSQPIHIKFVGVWETVGTLGIPRFDIRFISRSTLDFHDTGLRRPMENGFHALAIDEHRRQFPPTLWTVRRPKDSNVRIAEPRPLTSVEQRWFVGSHDNIGGGRKNDPLANIPLRWIMKKASLHGLAFRNDVVDEDEDVLKADIYNSYSDFMCGIYARFSSPYLRPIGEPPKEQSDGTHTIVNETIDVSVFDRWRSDSEYRPNNLVDWRKRRNVDIATLNKSVRADEPKEAVPDQ
jgi:uncharacterized protein (DUF2235 family)